MLSTEIALRGEAEYGPGGWVSHYKIDSSWYTVGSVTRTEFSSADRCRLEDAMSYLWRTTGVCLRLVRYLRAHLPQDLCRFWTWNPSPHVARETEAAL